MVSKTMALPLLYATHAANRAMLTDACDHNAGVAEVAQILANLQQLSDTIAAHGGTPPSYA